MSDEKIVISKFELHDPHIDDIVQMEKAAQRPLSAADRAPVETRLIFNPIVYTGLFGLFGAILAWGILEPFIIKVPGKGETGIGLILLFPVTSTFIGLFVGLIEGLMSRNVSKAIQCGSIGLGVGFAWGILGMFLGGFAFQAIVGFGAGIFRPTFGMKPSGGFLFMLITGRAVAWTIVAGGMGLGQGVALSSKKLVMNGIVGGLMGGFLGGLLFDPIGLGLDYAFQGYSSGAASRAIGISVIGLMVGVFLGLVENLSKEAWFIMKSGPLRGKQFVIYNNPVIIGSSPKSDVYIFKDPAIEPRHAEVFQVGSKFELRDCNSAQGIFVNGKRVKTKILEKNDVIVIGESVLEFNQRIK